MLAKVTPDANGGLTTAVPVPAAGSGDEHDVPLERDDGVVVDKAGFSIDMDVSIAPTVGAVGTPISITAHGSGFRSGNDSWQVSYDGTYTGWLSAVTTHGNATAVIPSTGGVGVHTVNGMHGDFTFPYWNPQQSPFAGRPE